MTAEEYRQSLIKPGNKKVRWTMDTFSTYVNLLYPHITVVPGQEWTGNYSKYKFVCDKHGPYEAFAKNVLARDAGNRGSACGGCKKEMVAARNYEITLSRVGTTTPDGHLILEHVGYHQTPSHKEKGIQGVALFRYKCANCGNDQAITHGNSLLRPGHTPNCSECQSKKETIQRHLRNKAKAMEPCQFYVASFYFDEYIKLGISKQYETRAASGNKGNMYYDKNLTPEEHYKAGNIDLSYEQCWYLSPPFPRAWVFSVEQILLAATKHYIPTEPLPKEVIETLWTGQSELRDFWLEPRKVQAAFIKLIAEIQRSDGDWYKVYQKHINKFKID